MNVTIYKDLLFVEEDLDTSCSYEKIINIRTTGFGNQLNSLDDIRKKIYTEVKTSNKEFNVLKNFTYGQQQNVVALDDISFYGKGIASHVPQEEYNKLKQLISIDSVAPQLIYSIKNEILYEDAPVQIDRVALYKFKGKFLGQIKLINFSNLQIKGVHLKFTTINSFGEASSKSKKFFVSRKGTDSNIAFGDDKTVVFEENDVSFFKYEIEELVTLNETINYNQFKTCQINRNIQISEKLSNELIDFLYLSKLKKIMIENKVDYHSFLPNISGNFMSDFKGEIHLFEKDSYLEEFLLYVDSDLRNDYLKHLKEERKKIENEKLMKEKEKKELKRNIEKKIALANSKKSFLCVFFVVAIFISVLYIVKVNDNSRIKENGNSEMIHLFDKSLRDNISNYLGVYFSESGLPAKEHIGYPMEEGNFLGYDCDVTLYFNYGTEERSQCSSIELSSSELTELGIKGLSELLKDNSDVKITELDENSLKADIVNTSYNIHAYDILGFNLFITIDGVE